MQLLYTEYIGEETKNIFRQMQATTGAVMVQQRSVWWEDIFVQYPLTTDMDYF